MKLNIELTQAQYQRLLVALEDSISLELEHKGCSAEAVGHLVILKNIIRSGEGVDKGGQAL